MQKCSKKISDENTHMIFIRVSWFETALECKSSLKINDEVLRKLTSNDSLNRFFSMAQEHV